MVDSVPELTMRTCSMPGMISRISSPSSTSAGQGAPKLAPFFSALMAAASTAGLAWPRSIGPQLMTKSSSSAPSTVHMRLPAARAMNTGSQPTLLQARTGLFTPPGRMFWARLK